MLSRLASAARTAALYVSGIILATTLLSLPHAVRVAHAAPFRLGADNPPATPTNTAVWLGLLAVAIHIALRLLKSDTLDAQLAKLGIPPVPAKALPALAIGVGVVAGVIDGLMAGQTWQAALVGALTGAFSGLGAVGIHETLIEKARGGREFFQAPTTDADDTQRMAR